MVKRLAFGGKASLLVTLLVPLLACGGSDPSISAFNKGAGSTDGTGAGSSGSSGNIGGNAGKSADKGHLAACATQSATAEARPVYLVFVFDKSGSMVEDGSPKWSSCKAATRAFFESPQSKGISASLTFFPNDDNSCSVGDYSTPDVALTALPSATFGQQLDNQQPDGTTPTRPALQGAISYAQQIANGQVKDGKVAIVLVTDGIPQNCNRNSIGDVKQLAASVAANVPTYVIGVGSELASLNEIAVGGGTKRALIVNVNNPAQIQADFTRAIGQIKAAALTCDYKIPGAPAGETFDRSKVNVQHVTSGATDTLPYNQACTGGTGWRYDDANAPTRILLCDGSCDSVKAKAGKVDILFGCATQTGPVK